MAIDPLPRFLLGTGAPAGVIDIEDLREKRADSPRGDEFARLEAELDTERRAGRALLGAVRDLEQRLDAERAQGKALLSAIHELDASLGDERRTQRSLFVRATMLAHEVDGLNEALVQARRPLWRKLLRRY